MTLTLTFYGEPENDDQFCDYADVDYDIHCDDHKLWVVEEDGEQVGYVCSPHKEAFTVSRDIA